MKERQTRTERALARRLEKLANRGDGEGVRLELEWFQQSRCGARTKSRAGALPDLIDAEALQAASDWAFARASPEQVTLSLIVVHGGDIVHERYAPGVDIDTRTRT